MRKAIRKQIVSAEPWLAMWLASALICNAASVENLVERVKAIYAKEQVQGRNVRYLILQEPKTVFLANGVEATTVVLRRTTWQMKQVDQISTPLDYQLVIDALKLPEDERLKLMNRFDDYTQLWWIRSDSASAREVSLKGLLKPEPLANRYHRELAWLGKADGFSWYGYMPIYEWIQLREQLELKGGDDAVAAAARGLAVDDPGSMTANSAEGLLVGAGPAAIPYMKAAMTTPYFRRAMRVLGGINGPDTTKLLMDYARSDNFDLAQAARHTLTWRIRPEAEELYFQWLDADAGKEPVLQILNTCARVNTPRLKLLLSRILSTPKSQHEFRRAFELSREISGRGIPADLLEAEKQIRTHGFRSGRNYDETKVNAAVAVLSRTEDVEAAAHLAISLACVVSKGDSKSVNDAGITVLQQLPGFLARTLTHTLVTSGEDDWSLRRLKAVFD